MKSISWFLLILIARIHYVDGVCPQATFSFSNGTMNITYNFIPSMVGNIGSLETCPYTGRPYVYLPCYPNSTWGYEPYFSKCAEASTTTPSTHFAPFPKNVTQVNPYLNMSIEEIAKLSIRTSKDASYVLEYFNQENLTFKSTQEIVSTVNIIDDLISNNQNISIKKPSNIYSIANKLLSSESISQMQETHETNRSIVRLLSSLETFFRSITTDQTFVEKNLAISIVNMPNNRSKSIVGFAFDPSKNETYPIGSNDATKNLTAIVLKSNAVSHQNRLAFAVYDHRNRMFDEGNNRVLTRVLSLTIDKPELTENLGSFVRIHFFLENNYDTNDENLMCAYWRIFDNMTAHWSTDGCRLIDIVDRNVKCECDHLTHFAVLMDIQRNMTSTSITNLLSFITLTGLLLSSVGLCLTILTFILFKKLRQHFSQKSLLLLSINLLFVNILFSIIALNKSKDIPCIIIASVLHYFILSSFSWMFIMALIQYLLFVKIFPRTISSFTCKAATFAQLVPMIPVVAILAIDPSYYTKRPDGICWLSDMPLYLSFILPIIIYIMINSILFSVVAHSLLCGKTGQQLRSTQMVESRRLSRFLLALSCFVVLGLTWIFGLLAMGPVRILFQILFCTFASLTGFFIFLLYIVTSKAKRKCWNNAFKSLGISAIYSPALSTSSALNGTKEFSTSSTSDHQKVPSRLVQFPSQPQHFIDAYMPSSPPQPAPPLPLPPPFLIEGDDPLNTTKMTSSFYETKNIWMPQTNYIYEANQLTTSLDDYSLFYASNHDATKL